MEKKLIFKDDKSDKFWNITVSGLSFTVTFGKSGTAGQSSNKTFDQETTCLTQAQKLIQEKLKKGYVEEGQTQEVSVEISPVEIKSATVTKKKPKPSEKQVIEAASEETEIIPIQESFDENLIHIRSFIQKNELMHAKDLCNAISPLIKSEQDGDKLSLLKGEIALIQNDFETAESSLLTAGPEADFLLGQIYQAKNDFVKASNYYLNAKSYLGYYYAAWIAVNQKDNAKAVQYFELAAIEGEKSKEKDLWQSYFRWGYTLHLMGDLTAAIVPYQKAIDTGNGDLWTYNNFAIACTILGKDKEAIALYDTAIAKWPEFSQTYFNKCCFYSVKGNLKEALVWLEKACYYGYLFHNEYNLKNDSDLEALRETDKYKELITKYKRDYSNRSCNDLLSEDFKANPEKYNEFEVRSYNKPLPNGAITSEIANGINIQTITVYDANLKSISPAVAELKKLKEIQLLDNPLMEFPEELLDLKLDNAELEFKRLAAFPSYLEKLSNLKKLGLSSLKVKRIPKEISHFKDLEDLCIKHGEIEVIDREIGSLNKLHSLEIRDTAITSLPVEIAQLHNLRTLYISDNKQLAHLPEDIFTMPKLERVSFAKNGFPGTEAAKLFEEGLNAKTEKRRLAVFLALLQRNNGYVAACGIFEDALAALNSGVGMLRSNSLIWISNAVQASFSDKPIASGSEVFILGKFSKSNADIKSEIEALGATVSTKFSAKTTHVLIGEKPGEKLNGLNSAAIQWVTEGILNKADATKDTQMEIAKDVPQEQIQSLLLSPEDSNVSMALELIEEYRAVSAFEAELFISYQYATDKDVKKHLQNLIKRNCSEDLQSALAGKYGFKSASEKKIGEYIQTLFEKAGLDKLKVAYTIFRKTNHKASNYLLEFGTSEMKKEVLESFIDTYEGVRNEKEEGLIQLGGNVPNEILELKNRIKKVSWRGGKELPLCITQLELLESLDLAMSGLSKLPKEIVNLQNLKKLDISTASFKKFPEEILSIPGLEELFLNNGNEDNKQCITEIPDSISQLKNLKKLDLTNNPIGKVPAAVFELENLEYLSIASIGISSVPNEIKKLKKLKQLVIHGWAPAGRNENNFEKFPSVISELLTLETLQTSLGLLNNPEVLSSLINLKKVRVYNGYNDEKREKLSKAVKGMLPQCEVSIW
ncbi:leucine-rich repeat domain-containing protein [Flavobacterium limi]|uniref:WGR domain-containing protein n=1 Tax=Flavobacterium limi TaxID=2045105 RepID=A0ABQ1UPH4_9FLAO|nr:WGR domain-containing protein [Flavobacterium limi]GGF23348.1 hypothetical protein GCM10011518_35810 [Flavobacterium limi]